LEERSKTTKDDYYSGLRQNSPGNLDVTLAEEGKGWPEKKGVLEGNETSSKKTKILPKQHDHGKRSNYCPKKAPITLRGVRKIIIRTGGTITTANPNEKKERSLKEGVKGVNNYQHHLAC